jgi:hypothetical protein
MSTAHGDQEVARVLERLLETVQDLFVYQALDDGVSTKQIRRLLRIDMRRVHRVSKIRPQKQSRKNGAER